MYDVTTKEGGGCPTSPGELSVHAMPCREIDPFIFVADSFS
jgi:hypothetical protein